MPSTAYGKYTIVHNLDYQTGKRTYDVTRDGNPVLCGFETVTDAGIWIDNNGPKIEEVKALWEDPKPTDTPEVGLLRQLLAQLPYRNQDRPGVIRAIEVLERYPKEAEA